MRLTSSTGMLKRVELTNEDGHHLLLLHAQNILTRSSLRATKLPCIFLVLVGLSYWLSRRLPIDDTRKLELLSIHCPTQRLLRGLQILKVGGEEREERDEQKWRQVGVPLSHLVNVCCFIRVSQTCGVLTATHPSPRRNTCFGTTLYIVSTI